MKVALTGASGYLGGFLSVGLRDAGHDLIELGRGKAGVEIRVFDLANPAETSLADCDVLIHAAFSHVPGRYRGGEGDDPATFQMLNLSGSMRLFEHARQSGVARVIFLSSRAVYDGLTGPLHEDMPLSPSSLYGQVKASAEKSLFSMSDKSFCGVSLRATGIYGRAVPEAPHKWQGLFADYLSGRSVAPRRATELHGADLAAAVLCLMTAPAECVAGRAFNASDILLDRADLLARVARLTGCPHPVPTPDKTPVAEMDCTALRAFGWHPGGMAQLAACLPDLVPPAPH
ncbi:MAG: NAD-dependent epimerase/dehydratase family protein [Paracoccaceae bacterium]